MRKTIRRLISIEGIECTGKTSIVVPCLAHILKHSGFIVETGREPGGSKRAEKLRRIIFEKSKHGSSQLELAELFSQARQIHINDIIRPFFKKNFNKNAIFLLDRYLDSTRVYQGLEGGVSLDQIFQLEKKYSGNCFMPDLTIILYLDTATFKSVYIQRKNQRNPKRAETDTSAWHNSNVISQLQRQKYYLQLEQIARQNGEKRQFTYINASTAPLNVITDSIDALQLILPNKLVESMTPKASYIPIAHSDNQNRI